MQVVEEEYELKQMKDMAAARKRWDAMVFIRIPRPYLIIFSLEVLEWK